MRCLQTLLIHFLLSVLLIACCGNMTPLAIDYGKAYKNVYTKYKPNVLALLIGLVSRIQSLHGSVVSRKFASSVLVKKPWNIKIRFIDLTLRVLFTYFCLFIYSDEVYILKVNYLLNVVSRLRIFPSFQQEIPQRQFALAGLLQYPFWTKMHGS